jgi:hypothetical protein
MCSEPLPVGFSHFAFFIGGNGAQSNVEIGIAQHDDAFKWLLKKSADGIPPHPHAEKPKCQLSNFFFLVCL